MSKCPEAAALLILLSVGTAWAQATPVATTAPAGAEAAAAKSFALGRPALPEEVAAWNTDVSPDGTGLPEGHGDVATGERLFLDNCASCHGDFAEGLDNWPSLSGGEGTLDRQDPEKTIGSYWPHLSTVWDYVHHSMPFGNARILSDDDAYAITAYLLNANSLVDDDFVLSKENFTSIQLPNADGFIEDDRPKTEYPVFSRPPCMTDCKAEVEITRHASVVDVTPEDSTDAPAGADSSAAPADKSELPEGTKID